jgi:hypothetical protein
MTAPAGWFGPTSWDTSLSRVLAPSLGNPSGHADTSIVLPIRLEPNRTPDVLLPTRQRLDELAALEDDWDSYGGFPPALPALTAADAFIRVAMRDYGTDSSGAAIPFSVMPIADGGVGIEWRRAEIQFNLDIAPDGSLSYLLVTATTNGPVYEEQDGISRERALELIGRVIAG